MTDVQGSLRAFDAINEGIRETLTRLPLEDLNAFVAQPASKETRWLQEMVWHEIRDREAVIF